MDPLASVDDLASYLQRDLDRATADVAVAGSSGAVRAYCRWAISQEQTTFTVDATGATLVSLPTLRLVDVSAVRVGGNVLSANSYDWSERGQLDLSRTAAGYPARLRWIEVDCTHGYTPDEMPDEVRQVVLAMAARNMANPEGLSQRIIGSTQRQYNLSIGVGELAAGEKNLIAGHRLP